MEDVLVRIVMHATHAPDLTESPSLRACPTNGSGNSRIATLTSVWKCRSVTCFRAMPQLYKSARPP